MLIDIHFCKDGNLSLLAVVHIDVSFDSTVTIKIMHILSGLVEA